MDSICGGLQTQFRDKDWQQIEAQCKMLDDSQLWISDLSLSSPRGRDDSVAYELGVKPVFSTSEPAKFRVVMGGPQEDQARSTVSGTNPTPSIFMTGSPASAGIFSHASDVFPISSPSGMHASPPLRQARRPVRLTLSDNRQDSFASAQDIEPPLRSPGLSVTSSRSSNSGRLDFGGTLPHTPRGLACPGTWQAGWSGSDDGRRAEGRIVSYPPLEVEFVDGALEDDEGYPPLEVELVDGSLEAESGYEADDATRHEQGWSSHTRGWGESYGSSNHFAHCVAASRLSPRLSLKMLPSEADARLRMADYAPFQPITPQPALHSRADRWPRQFGADRMAASHGRAPLHTTSPGVFRVDRGGSEFCGSMSIPIDGNYAVSPVSSSGSLSASSRDNSGKIPLACMGESLDVGQAHPRFDLASPSFPSSTSESGKLSLPSPSSETCGGRLPGARLAFRETGSKGNAPAWSAVVPSLTNKLQRQPSVGPTILEEEEGEGAGDNGCCVYSRTTAPAPVHCSNPRGAATMPRMTLFQAMSSRAPQGNSGGSTYRSFDSDARSEASSYAEAERASLPTKSPQNKERSLKKSNSANERKGPLEEDNGEAPLVRRAYSGNRVQVIAQGLSVVPSSGEPCSHDASMPKLPRRPVYLGSGNSMRKFHGDSSSGQGQGVSARAEVAGKGMDKGLGHPASSGAYKPACSWVVLPICAVDKGSSERKIETFKLPERF